MQFVKCVYDTKCPNQSESAVSTIGSTFPWFECPPLLSINYLYLVEEASRFRLETAPRGNPWGKSRQRVGGLVGGSPPHPPCLPDAQLMSSSLAPQAPKQFIPRISGWVRWGLTIDFILCFCPWNWVTTGTSEYSWTSPGTHLTFTIMHFPMPYIAPGFAGLKSGYNRSPPMPYLGALVLEVLGRLTVTAHLPSWASPDNRGSNWTRVSVLRRGCCRTKLRSTCQSLVCTWKRALKCSCCSSSAAQGWLYVVVMLDSAEGLDNVAKGQGLHSSFFLSSLGSAPV